MYFSSFGSSSELAFTFDYRRLRDVKSATPSYLDIAGRREPLAVTPSLEQQEKRVSYGLATMFASDDAELEERNRKLRSHAIDPGARPNESPSSPLGR